MFTGIIQSSGIIENIDFKNNIYLIKTNLSLLDCKIGSSICCDGVCLTAISIKNKGKDFFFEVNIGEETIKRSNLGDWIKGYKINIEKSLKVGDEIAGHFVYGHIDSTVCVKNINNLQKSWEFEFSIESLHNSIKFKKYLVEKGSVTINGISLTVANIFKNSFNISVLPHTFNFTNLSSLNIGDKVNIEFDPLARYISDNYAK